VRGIDEWLTGEDESVAVGVREGARGGGNGRAVGAATLCCRCLDACPHKPASLHRQLRLPRAADPALARLAAAWISARLPSSLRAPLPYCRPAPPRTAPAPPRPLRRSWASHSRASWPARAAGPQALLYLPRARRVLLSCASAARGSAGGGSRSAGCRCCWEPARHTRLPGRSQVARLQWPHGTGVEEEMKERGRIKEGSAWEGQCANMLSTLDPTWRST